MLNLAIIGCGRISYKHVRAALDNQERVRLVAVCDTIMDRAEKRADEYSNGGGERPKVYDDYHSMINHEDIDMVAICTDSGSHAEISLHCMDMKKHVIVEKPMALSTSDADKMIDASQKNHTKLAVCHQNRFNPPIQALRKAIEDGRFGRIIAGNARILWNRGEDYYRQADWRGTYKADGGCLMNQCIHDIDLLQWMLGGDVKCVNGEVGNFMHPYIEAEDYGSIQIRFNNGAIGNVEGTICIYPNNLEETLTVIGERGVVSIGGLAVNKIEAWRFEDSLDTEEEMKDKFNADVDSVYGNGHTPFYRDVITAIENDTEPYIAGNEGKKAMQIILAAYQSNKTEKRVSFPLGNISSEDFK